MIKKILKNKNTKPFLVFLFIFLIALNGYFRYEDFVDNEKLEIETSISNKETNIVKSSTTTVPILVYHKIGNHFLLPIIKNNNRREKFSVENDVFEQQMQYIKSAGYTPLTITDLINDEKTKNLPKKPIAITFDDGWRSQYDVALPILNKYNIPATFYIYTGVIGCPAYMTWSDLQTLVNSNMEIGGHTKTHPRLTKVNPNKLDDELLKSKFTLEQKLHIIIADFAYPYGDYNDSIIEALKKDGYRSARTSQKGIYNDFKDLYKLNVIYAPSDLQTLKDLIK